MLALGLGRVSAVAGFALLALSPAILAHVSGHGAAMKGKGPGGGNLAAVISADEAELGDRARTLAIGEWVRRDDEIEVRFWDPALKAQVAIAGAGEIKWIVLRAGDGEAGKPVVLKTSASSAASLARRRFEPALLSQATSVELILPPAEAGQAKKVVILQLNPETNLRKDSKK